MTLYMSVQKVPRFAASRDTQSPSTSSPAGNNIPLKQPVVGGHNTSLEQPVLVDQQASLSIILCVIMWKVIGCKIVT